MQEGRNVPTSKCRPKLDFFKGLGQILEFKRKRKEKNAEWPPGDVKPGKEEGYAAWLINFAVQETYEKEMEYCCRDDLPERLNILCNHLKENGLKVQDVKNRDKVSWLVLATCNNSTKASMVLIKFSDRDIVMQPSEMKNYVGITPLHCAVVNNMTDFIKEMFDKLENEDQLNLIHHQIIGEKIRERKSRSSLALNLSCWVGSIDIFDELVYRGAELDKKDKRGNNVIHTLVEVSTERPDDAKAMLSKVFGSLATRRWFCQRQDIEEKYWTSQEDKDLKKLLLTMENDDGYTPLTLAARLGATEMLDYIINCEGVYRNTMWQFGLDYIVKYDVTEINQFVLRDRHVERPSVMNLLVYRGINIKSLEAFSIPLIQKLIQIRWKYYRFLYMFWAIWHILSMIFCFYIPLTYINGKDAFLYPKATRTLPQNATLLPISEGIFDLRHMSEPTQVVLFFIFLILLCTYLLGCILFEIYDSFFLGLTGLILFATRKWHGRYYNAPFSVIVKWDLFRFVLVIFVVSEVLLLRALFVDAKLSYGLTVISSICGWYFVLFFFQGFRSTGYFSVIMHRILFTDMLSFGYVFLVVLLGFGTSMIFLVNVDNAEIGTDEGFDTIWASLYTMIKAMSGFAGEPQVTDEARQTIISIAFIFFILLTIFLLLNMLIAAMSSTYSILNEYQEQLWLRSTAAAMLLIERQFFRCFSILMNKRCLTYDEDTDRWFFQIETQVAPSTCQPGT